MQQSNAWDRDEARRRVLMLLEERRRRRFGEPPRPISARRLAWAAGVAPRSGVETRRRRVRELIDDLRREGVPVVAQPTGYHLAETIEDMLGYEQVLHRLGVAMLLKARAARRSQARADAAGQLGLFDLVGIGSASRGSTT